MTESVGSGIAVGIDRAVIGRVVAVDGPEQVLELLDSGIAGYMLLVGTASATGIAPILPEAEAVVCTSGGATSHLALVCKEFGIPCLMSTVFADDPASLHGQQLELRPEGTLHRGE